MMNVRPGPEFGRCFTLELGPDTAVFVPRGVGNAFQTLEDETVYSYLVNDHWSPAGKDSYTFVNLADESLAIDWPISLAQAELSAADQAHPRLDSVVPMPNPPSASASTASHRTVVSGATTDCGRVGRSMDRVTGLTVERLIPLSKLTLAFYWLKWSNLRLPCSIEA